MEISTYKQSKDRQRTDDRITYLVFSVMLLLVWLGGYVGILD